MTKFFNRDNRGQMWANLAWVQGAAGRLAEADCALAKAFEIPDSHKPARASILCRAENVSGFEA